MTWAPQVHIYSNGPIIDDPAVEQFWITLHRDNNAKVGDVPQWWCAVLNVPNEPDDSMVAMIGPIPNVGHRPSKARFGARRRPKRCLLPLATKDAGARFFKPTRPSRWWHLKKALWR